MEPVPTIEDQDRLELDGANQVIASLDSALEDLVKENDRLKEELEKRQKPVMLSVAVGGHAGQGFRQASVAEYFPYRAKTVPFIMITKHGTAETAQHPKDKLCMVLAKEEGDVILAVWPGQWRSDVFEIDDLELAKKELFA